MVYIYVVHHKDKLYFEDPLLKMGMGTRLWAKSLRGILNVVFLVGGLVMLFSDVPSVLYLGVLLLALSAYSLFLRGLLARGRSFRGGNLLHFTGAESRKLLESAIDRSTLMGGSFFLHLARELADASGVEEMLNGFGITKGEFAGQAEGYLEEEKHLRETREWKLKRAEELVVKAFSAQAGRKRPIAPRDLFKAMVYMENERVQRLFGIFGITGSVIEGGYKRDFGHVG